MAKTFVCAVAVMLSVALFLGCNSGSGGGGGGGGTSVMPPPVANVDGIWDGLSTVTGGTQAPVGLTFSFIFTLTQVGSAVTGTVVTSGGLVSDVTGTLNGQVFTFTLAQGAPCVGSFSGAGTASGGDTLLIGSYVGSDCSGTLSADFAAAKR